MKFYKYLGWSAIILFSTLVGFTCHNFPLITFKKEVTIAEVANFCLTLAIGTFIPYLIYKTIDAKRNQKTEVIEDCKNLLSEVRKVKDRIDVCFVSGSITQADKNIINSNFESAQDKIYNLHSYLEALFNADSYQVHSAIEKAYDEYWKSITNGSLMGSMYTVIDPILQSEQTNKWSALELCIRTTIMKIIMK